MYTILKPIQSTYLYPRVRPRVKAASILSNDTLLRILSPEEKDEAFFHQSENHVLGASAI